MESGLSENEIEEMKSRYNINRDNWKELNEEET
jgi:hypothetical protein